MPHRLHTSALLALMAMSILAFGACSTGDGDGASPGTDATPFVTSPASPGSQPITLVGTGDSTPPTCRLLDVDELSSIAGEPMGNPAELSLGPPLGQQVCTFGALSGTSYTIAQVSLVSQHGISDALRDEGFTVEKLFDETFIMFPNAVLVHGIGDAAFRHENTLEVLAGDYAFSVSLARNDGALRKPASLATLVALAHIVLDRIEVPS